MPGIDNETTLVSNDDLDLLLRAAREAGEIAMRFFGKEPEVWMKGGTSPVSEADYAVDSYLRAALLEAHPDHGWLSEETADDLSRLEARRTFVVDPIDGTRAFLAGKSTWCVAAAIVEAGRPLVGVLECPAKKETYWAVAGAGAFCNGKRIQVRQGVPHKIAGPKALVERLPQTWLDRSEVIGYVPSLAYRLALIATGELEASFVKPNSHDWDIAAADIILREAGGSVLAGGGSPPRYGMKTVRHEALCAGSGELLAVMANVLDQLRE